MTKITDAYQSRGRRPLVVCDFSPPRGVDFGFIDDARGLDVDFISVNYNPGRVPRADSAMAAHLIHRRTGRDVMFTLAVRDMNPLALQSHLLGAALLGLENLVIVGGDPFAGGRRGGVSSSGGRGESMTSTQLMRTVAGMNRGVDRRGRPLDGRTNLCIGGVMDLGGDIESAARLTHAKIRAGAEFFLTQPVFDIARKRDFEVAYAAIAGEPLRAPVFYGIQLLRPGGPAFSAVPARYLAELNRGRSGEDIALEVWEGLAQAGAEGLYLIPPIGPRGARDYEAAARFLQRIRPCPLNLAARDC